MAATKGKKASSKKSRTNPPEYDAFIARGRTLTEAEMHLFYHGLRRLRRALNNASRFEKFIQTGVTEIILTSDALHSRQFRSRFRSPEKGRSRHPLVKWVASETKKRGVAKKRYWGFMSIATPPGDREFEVRAKFALLRDTLNNRVSRRAVAAVGPCALSIWDPKESCQNPNGHPAILISNFIPGCMPNADFSIVPLGARADAPNGIWEHG